MQCESCQAVNPSGNAFCGKCGAALSDSSGAVPVYPTRASNVGREMTLIAAGILAILVAVYGAWYFMYAQRSPDSVVRRFIEADRSGDMAAERKYVSSRFDSHVILSALQAVRTQIGVSPFNQYRILRSSITGETAFVYVELTFPRTTPFIPNITTPAAPNPAVGPIVQQLPIYLIREDGEWKIDSTQTVAGITAIFVALGVQQMAPNFTPPAGFPGFPGAATPTAPPQQPMPSTPGSISL